MTLLDLSKRRPDWAEEAKYRKWLERVRARLDRINETMSQIKRGSADGQ